MVAVVPMGDMVPVVPAAAAAAIIILLTAPKQVMPAPKADEQTVFRPVAAVAVLDIMPCLQAALYFLVRVRRVQTIPKAAGRAIFIVVPVAAVAARATTTVPHGVVPVVAVPVVRQMPVVVPVVRP